MFASSLGRSTAAALASLPAAATMGGAGLPHRNASDGARFAWSTFDIPTAPSLPRRSPAESPIHRVLLGVRGVSAGPYGTLVVDPSCLDPEAPVHVDLDDDRFVGLRAFLTHLPPRDRAQPGGSHVAWYVTGPLSVGAALRRAGADDAVAFRVATRVVAAHVSAVAQLVATALPDVQQVIMVDEPRADEVVGRAAPIGYDQVVDALSRALATIEQVGAAGVHCCGGVDPALAFDAGPAVVALPVAAATVACAGRLERFLAAGGRVAWGAVATSGPIGIPARRHADQLRRLWRRLADRGCEGDALVHQSILTPECSLGTLGVATADAVCRTLAEVAADVRRGGPTRSVLGA